MTINNNDVSLVLDDHLPLPPLNGYPTPQQKQDREHTKMFLTEIQLRYPAGPGAPPNLVTAAITAVNMHPTITAPIVRQEISNQENLLGLPDSAPVVPVPADARADFLDRLAARRGAYTWVPGPSQAFTTWVQGPSPLEYRIGITAQINCWEAVLVAAAESGLVSLGTVRGAYIGNNVAERVLYVLVRTGATAVNHAANSPGANGINAGDVILIDGATGPLHHVVAATVPNPADYRNVEVMSLWTAVGGGLFNQATLGELLPVATTLWYAPL